MDYEALAIAQALQQDQEPKVVMSPLAMSVDCFQIATVVLISA